MFTIFEANDVINVHDFIVFKHIFMRLPLICVIRLHEINHFGTYGYAIIDCITSCGIIIDMTT